MSETEQLALLVAHAPPVPEWWQPQMEPAPKKQRLFNTKSGQFAPEGLYVSLIDFADRPHLTLKDTPEYEEWQARRQRERLFQWPIHYAREMLCRINRLDRVVPPTEPGAVPAKGTDTLLWGQNIPADKMERLRNGEVFILLDPDGNAYSQVMMDGAGQIRERRVSAEEVS